MPDRIPVVHVVDDDDAVRDSLEALLLVSGFEVHTYASAEAFLERASAQGCLVLDVNMPGIGGLELLGRLRDEGRLLPVILLTARRDEGLRELAIARGASEFLNKPVTEGELLRAIARAGACAAAQATHKGNHV